MLPLLVNETEPEVVHDSASLLLQLVPPWLVQFASEAEVSNPAAVIKSRLDCEVHEEPPENPVKAPWFK
jgi:hypothetical protein